MSPITCRSCGKPNHPQKNFCVDCGKRLELACPACGGEIGSGENYCGHCGVRLETPKPSRPDGESPSDLRAGGGERRQLTVLFADLVGSTRMSTNLDPEEYHQIIQAYHQAVARVVARFDGYVAQYQGDGIVAYFGWPLAHGDDPERAIRSGLEIIEAINGINRGLPAASQIAVRVGIDTGPVMVGQLGGGARREITAVGETPNIAARTQSLAPAGALAITAATSRLVPGLFALESLGPLVFKGLEQPLEIFRVLRATGVRSRLQAARTLTPFVGRDEELHALAERWELARAGTGQVVVIRGEPGIGKSRLAHQFRETLADLPHSWLESFCSSFDLSTPFVPLVNLLVSSFLWTGNETPEERLTELEQSLREAELKVEEALPLFAEMLNLPLPDRYPPSLSPPDQRRRRLIAVIAQWIFSLARLQPLVLLLEDAQWADPSTMELNQVLVEQCADLPMLLMYTTRPEFVAPWSSRDNHHHLLLTRLSSRHTREMARLAVAQAALPERTLDLVAERTEGVPLFVEELARVVAETDGAAGAPHQIPATLADSLMARIDRLGAAREIAQIAAVVGRSFSYEMLRAITGRPDAELRSALDRLVDADLVAASGSPADPLYLYKHVMVRDTAYGSLLRSRRRELHRAVAQALSVKFAPQAAADPALLAYHLTEAGENDGAAAAWQRAADRSTARGAFAEAETHYSRALELLGTLPESEARNEREIALLVSLGSVLSPTKGLASREVETIFLRARELGGRLGRVRPAAILGLWQTYLMRGELAAAQELAQQRFEIAKREGAPLSLCWGNFALGATMLHRGMLPGSLTHLRAAVEQSHTRDSATRPFDASLLAMSYLSVALVMSGYPDQAREMALRTMRTAEELAKPSNIVFCAVNICATHQLLFNPAAVVEIARSAGEIGRAHGVTQLASALDVYAGWAVAASGDPRAGADQLRRGIAGWLADGGRLPHAWYLSMLAWTYGLDQRFDEAEDTLQDAAAAIGELHMEEPIVAWTRADILRMSGADRTELEAAWRAAIDSARAKAMPLFELRSTIGLARALAGRGERAEAAAMLAVARRFFTEGADTFDLIAADRLLAELAG